MRYLTTIVIAVAIAFGAGYLYMELRQSKEDLQKANEAITARDAETKKLQEQIAQTQKEIAKQAEETNKKTAALTSPTRKPDAIERDYETNIHNGSMSLEPGTHKTVKISVPKEARNPRLIGNFQTTTGRVSAFLFLPDEYINWKSRGDHKTVFQSGDVAIKKIETPLTAGQEYIFVLDSTAWLTKRDVSLKLSLHYHTFEYN